MSHVHNTSTGQYGAKTKSHLREIDLSSTRREAEPKIRTSKTGFKDDIAKTGYERREKKRKE